MMEIVDRQGYCLFCGQARVVKAPETLDQDKVDEMVTNYCFCEEAAEQRRQQEWADKYEKAKKAIDKLFDEDWVDAADVFRDNASKVANGDIESITIKHPDYNWTAKMTRTKDGLIKVTRTETKKMSQE